MLFNSLHYFLFLPLVVVLYYLIKPKFRWMLIFVASCYFYMAFVPKYILVLFLIIIIDYLAALTIEQVQGRLKLFYLVASLTANILLLAFFKYFTFLNDNLEMIFSFFGKDYHRINLEIILPIGLSFHTFQSMAYTIEVYRGNQKAEKHLGYFANYVLFFPQMVAGPIERYATLGKELKEWHAPQYKNFADGFKLILFGLFIKMTIADNLAPFINQVYNDPMKYSSMEVLSSVFAFSFQIYADFFGYSTIALGSAKLLGVTIMDNFNTPYLSKSITEFWSRWHISLSTWFRDYLYISLGGNRVALPRWSFNIMVVFMVSGLWHGASWTFVVWGALHGLMLLAEKYFSKLTKFEIKQGWSALNIFLGIKTFVVTSFIWIFFRAEDFQKAKLIIKSVVQWRGPIYMSREMMVLTLIACLVLLFDMFYYNSRFERSLSQKNSFVRWTVYALLIFGLLALSGTQKFAFIYFQF